MKAVIGISLVILALFLISCSSSETNRQSETANPVEAPKKTTTSYEKTTSNSDTFINNQKLTQSQIAELTATYGTTPLPGKYWYDSTSGSYGIWHGTSLGVLLPGHDFGSLPADASNGRTNVFINGRELPEADVQFLEWIFGIPRQEGHYWQDALGNIGYENDSTPLANLYIAYQQRLRASGFYGSGDNFWAANFGSYGNEQNGFGYVMVDGASVTYDG